jgi:MFS family permease
MEISTGIAALVFGGVLWSAGWWHWILIGCGVLGVSPWPGARAILRKAEKKPSILISDPERRRRRKRRMALWLPPVAFVYVSGLGYVLGGWGVAITCAVLGGLGIGLGTWISLRADRRGPDA